VDVELALNENDRAGGAEGASLVSRRIFASLSGETTRFRVRDFDIRQRDGKRGGTPARMRKRLLSVNANARAFLDVFKKLAAAKAKSSYRRPSRSEEHLRLRFYNLAEPRHSSAGEMLDARSRGSAFGFRRRASDRGCRNQ